MISKRDQGSNQLIIFLIFIRILMMSDENINYSSNDDANAISYLNERKVELKKQNQQKKKKQKLIHQNLTNRSSFVDK